MAKFPPDDPVNALVPHTLKEPMAGSGNGPLAGRSFMVKDLFAIKGHKVSIGNPEWYAAASPAAETAPALLRLLDAGATLTGITICDELLYSVLGTNVHYGAPVNIHALRHVTGGSSCGSAAAVAAAMCDFALGSDTGGSIRVPAAFCGLYGLRPTHGRIDMSGVTPMAPSYDTVGFLARDAALFRDVGRVLLQGSSVAAPLQHVILAQDMFARGEASIDEEIWRVLDKIESALPKPEQMDVVGEEFDTWRNAFRFNQGYELQSTLMPFALAHADALSPAIRERFDIASRITKDEARIGEEIRAAAKERLQSLAKPGTSDPHADDTDAAARARHSGRRLDRRVQGDDLGQHLPRRTCRPAADFHSGGNGGRLPGRPLLHRLGGRRRGPARSRRQARATDWGGERS